MHKNKRRTRKFAGSLFLWYNLSENEPKAKFEVRFTHAGTLDEIKENED